MSKPDDSEAKGDKDKAEESKEEVAKPAVKPATRDDDDDEDEDEDDEEEAVSSKPPRASKAQAARSAKSQKPAPSAAGRSVPVARVAAFLVVTLAAGGAAGWFGHEAQAKAKVQAESVATPAASGSAAPAGPCGAWQQKICDSGGATSSACSQAKGAIELLTPSSCEAALSMLPATLTKLKAARASCDKLVSKLCKDLPQGSPACTLVKDKTPAFPSQRCDEMLQHYDEVLGSLREIDQQGGPGMRGPGGPSGHGGPGMSPPGMSPPPMPAQSPH